MMQLAVITDEIDPDLAHALDVMAEYDIHYAELRAIGETSIAKMSDDEVAEVKSLLESRGASAVCVASPFYKCDLPDTGERGIGALHGADATGFQDQMDLLARCIRTANLLGAPFVRTFSFWRHGSLTPEIEERIIDAYALPARLAAEAGVTLLLENEHACYVGTGAEAARIVSKIASPAVKIVWDPGNAIYAGEVAYPSGYEAVKPLMAHMHVKDAKPSGAASQLEWTVVGEGVVDWQAQLKALKADGYSGFLSMETHYDGLGNKEASTRQCIEALKGLLAGL